MTNIQTKYYSGIISISFIFMTLGLFSYAYGQVGIVDDVIEVIIKSSGKALPSAARKQATRQLAQAAQRHGDDVFESARNGGIKLIEAAGKHGDDVWTYSRQYPKAARAIASNADELIPLTRRIGGEVLELEAKRPGMSRDVIRQFGENSIKFFAKNVSDADAARMLSYARRADTPSTRKLLLKNYQQRGNRFLNSLDWKKILATGLTASVIIGTYKVSDGIEGGLEEISKKHPEVFRETASDTIQAILSPFLLGGGVFFGGMALMLLWRFRKLAFSHKPPIKKENSRN